MPVWLPLSVDLRKVLERVQVVQTRLSNVEGVVELVLELQSM